MATPPPRGLADALGLRISIAATLALLGHVQHLPLWISLGYLLTLAWYLLSLYQPRWRPSAWVRIALALPLAFAIFNEFGFSLGRNSGVALLVVMLGFKLLEMYRERDAYVVLFLAYFTLATTFFYWQDFMAALYLLSSALLLTAALIDLNHPGTGLSFRRKLWLGGTLLLQGAPLALVLFILFPRLDGPLWAMPDDNTATTGLSDSMAPGRISQLILSTAIAFRVEFQGTPPPSPTRYFRGPVLWHTDGIIWSAPLSRAQRLVPNLVNLSDPLRYSVTLEPHQQGWLMGLDWVAPGAETLYGTVQRDMQLLTPSLVQNRLRYEVVSYMRGQNMSLKPLERALYTQLPQTLNPEVQQLATQWRNQTSDADAIVKQAMQYFRSQGFTYTLQPPLLGSDPVAEFLFKTKRGFCEHYAAAMTTLLRASNVPARVVTGYLGGEINPLDGTLVVRQSDAHAWVEAWSDTHGWFRVDPTAVVAPERLENSLTNRVASSDGSLRFNIDAGWLRSVWRQTSFGWDAVNNAWHQWVMGYTQKRQQNLLADWGIDNRRWQQLSLVLLGGIGLVGAGMTLWIMRRQARRYDPVTTLYHGYCHRLARCGLLRLSHEGPWDYCQRICTQRPELAAYVRRVTRLYLPLRYGTDPVTRADLSELRLAIRQPLPKLKHSDQVPTRVLGVVQRSIGAGDQGVN